MIISMTGFGRSEVSTDSITVSTEMRSVNNRFLEVSIRMPREFNAHEGEVRDIVRKHLMRGKINVNVTVERSTGSVEFQIDPDLVKSYKDALDKVRKAAKIREAANLGHLLQFAGDLMQVDSASLGSDEEWAAVAQSIEEAAAALEKMRRNEGRELARDIRHRLKSIDEMIDKAEKMSKQNIENERKRLRERVAQLFENDEIDEQRLEFEILLLADKLDVTEECVRYRSHSKYFLDAVQGPEPAGRKLGFLLQEIHREVTTIGSKSNNVEIAHLVVRSKEELEKIREQIQNIE